MTEQEILRELERWSLSGWKDQLTMDSHALDHLCKQALLLILSYKEREEKSPRLITGG